MKEVNENSETGWAGLHWIERFISSFLPKPIEYPERYEGDWQPKQTKDGKWCLWNSNMQESRDLVNYGFNHKVSSNWFKDCVGTRKQVHEAWELIKYQNDPFLD